MSRVASPRGILFLMCTCLAAVACHFEAVSLLIRARVPQLSGSCGTADNNDCKDAGSSQVRWLCHALPAPSSTLVLHTLACYSTFTVVLQSWQHMAAIITCLGQARCTGSNNLTKTLTCPSTPSFVNAVLHGQDPLAEAEHAATASACWVSSWLMLPA